MIPRGKPSSPLSAQYAEPDIGASGLLPEAHDTRLAKRLIYIIICGLLAAFAWAALTPVDEITSGEGKMRTRTLVERVEHIDGGVVSRLTVAPGDSVAEGGVIMAFDTTSLEREYETLKARMAALDAEAERLAFVLSGSRMPEGTQTGKDLTPEEQVFWAEQAYLEAKLAIIAAEFDTIENRLISIENTREIMSREATILDAQLERLRQLRTSGAVRSRDIERTEREALQTERGLLDLTAQIVEERSALRANELRRNELIADRRREAALRQAELQEKLVAARQGLAEIEARLARATVTATVGGVVQSLSVSNPQEVVAPGDLIAEIVPEGSALEAEIEVPAGQVGAIEPGMVARLKVTTFDFTRFGVIEGTVASISPTSFENELGEMVFRVIIALPNDGVDAELAGRPLWSGLTVQADILSDRKTILSYLLKPLREIRSGAFTEA